MTRGELLKPCDDGADAAGARVVERAAAEGGEAGAEQHRGVDEVGAFNDALAQAGDALVDHDEDQAIDEIGRLVGGWLKSSGSPGVAP